MTKRLSLAAASLLLGATLFTGCAPEDGKDGTNGTNGTNGTDASVYVPTVTASAKTQVLTTYANIALANYSDALADAKKLQTALATFGTTPTQANMDAAKEAWLQARESYGPTEIFRLSNGPVDAEEGWVATTYEAPEGMMNAWPLDEAGIDYTRGDDNLSAENVTGTIIGLDFSLTADGETTTVTQVSDINKTTLASINEAGGDANVFTGYHAIEFLLWGQDQDYPAGTAGHPTATEGPLQAGNRPLTDYTTDGSAAARIAYLNAAADLLVDNLTTMVDAWKSNSKTNYRAAFLGYHTTAANNIAANDALKDVMAGMGVFIKSELANERMAVAIQTPSEEDEHSCFSDNTHRDIALNYEGFKMILTGEYNGATAVKGASMLSFADADTQNAVNNLIREIDTGVDVINVTAETSEHFDYQIKTTSANRENAYNTKNAMRSLGDKMVDVANAYGITLTEGDVTDGEESEVAGSL